MAQNYYCIIRDGEMKLAELAVEITDLENCSKISETIPFDKSKEFHHVVLTHQ